MYVIVPHVGKSHLTIQTLQSIPDEHTVILVDGSYVADLDTYAANHAQSVVYVRPEPLQCLAHNWNIGADRVPEDEHVWLFCASDIQWHPAAWKRLSEQLRLYPDCGIVRDQTTNWNVWAVRRWAWRLLAPMDERYKPCGGEDDDLVAKCHHAEIRIRAGWIGATHLEGGHATRLDIRRELAGTTWDGRHKNIALFRRKWGFDPALSRDEDYQRVHAAVHVTEKRENPPGDWGGHDIPQSRPPWPDGTPPLPDPLRIHIGCGKRRLDGFVNCDIDDRAKADVTFDAANGRWPFPEGRAERIEAYHVIEHMSREEGARFLEHAWLALKGGGKLVLECPDLGAVCERFARSQRKMSWSLYGDQSTPHRFHRWGYSRDTIRLALDRAGFRMIEVKEGTDYHAESEPCLRAEAVK